jgi:hypothetical protein
MSDISSVQYISDTEIARQDAEEALLIQEYDKVKAKLAQIQEKLKRKELEKNEKATASAAVLECEEEAAVPTPDPKGVVNYEHEDIITILSDTDKEDHMDTESLLDLHEAGNTDRLDGELADEDIGAGDPNVNIDIDPFDQPSSNPSQDTDASDSDLLLASDEEVGENRLGENEWRIEPPPERSYHSFKEAKEAALKLCADHGFEISQTDSKRRSGHPAHAWVFRCTRHGVPDNKRNLTDKQRIRKKRGTKKTDCKMALWIKAVDCRCPHGEWKIQYYQGLRSHIHNHPPVKKTQLTLFRHRQ